MPFASDTFVYWEGEGHSKQFHVFGGRHENVSNNENPPGPPVTL